VSTKELRGLERDYRRDRTAILEDPGLSWEKKMVMITELHKRYCAAKDPLRSAGAEKRGA
jgi:hypothetical protein